jgi:hypothetical protein
MGFLVRFALGLVALPALLRSWPQIQLLPVAGALVNFSARRFFLRQDAKTALTRAVLLLLVLEVLIGLFLAALQAYFYWTPG